MDETSMSSLRMLNPDQLFFLDSLLGSPSTILTTEAEPSDCADSDQDESEKPDPTLGTNFADLLQGGAGLDHFIGLNGNDTVRGLQGKDWLYGENGDDLLDGGEGRDILHGGNGNDELRGGKGRDDLFGENGNDLLIGGCGPDLMVGGRGDDVLFGGNAPDTYTGGLGRDVFVLALPGGGGGHDDGGETLALIAPMAHDEEEADVITDFRQGVDLLALVGGLTFEQLLFQDNHIYVIKEEKSELTESRAISLMSGGDHDDHGRLLATLSGFDTTTLRRADFANWGDLSMA